MDGVVVEMGGVGGVGVIVGECVNHLLCHWMMYHWLYWKGCWSVGVQLQRDAFTRMGGGPSHQADLGVEWRGGGDVSPFGTNISRLMLHESSFVGNCSGRFELRIHPEKGDEGFQP